MTRESNEEKKSGKRKAVFRVEILKLPKQEEYLIQNAERK